MKRYPRNSSTMAPANPNDNDEMVVISDADEANNTAAMNAMEMDTAQPTNHPANNPHYWRSVKMIELLICFLPVPVGIGLEFGKPHERPIPFQKDGTNSSILELMYNNRKPQSETVPSPIMFVFGIAVPFLLQIFLSWRYRRGHEKESIHKTFCVYFMAVGWTQTLTNLAKLYAGYLRPIFYDFCAPDDNMEDCTSHGAHHGRVSFPSGHSSLSVCGLLLFSLFLEDTFGISSFKKMNYYALSKTTQETEAHRQQHPPWWSRVVSVVCYAPMLLAFFIVVSRVHDNFHHPADVVGGALLGGSIALLVFGIWFG